VDPATFASLSVLNHRWRSCSNTAPLYAYHLARCPSYANDPNYNLRTLLDYGHARMKKLFAQEVKRNFFAAYRHRQTTYTFSASSTASSSMGFRAEQLSFSFSPSGRVMLVLSVSRIFIVDIMHQKPTVKRELKIIGRPAAVDISDDARVLAVLSVNRKVDIYHLHHSPPRRVRSFHLESQAACIALSPDCTVLAAAFDRSIEMVYLSGDPNTVSKRTIACQTVDHLRFSATGMLLLGTTMTGKAATIALHAPAQHDSSLHKTLDQTWTSELPFPNTFHECSHAIPLNDIGRESGRMAFAYDAPAGVFGTLDLYELRFATPRFDVGNHRTPMLPLPWTLPSVSTDGDFIALGYGRSNLLLCNQASSGKDIQRHVSLHDTVSVLHWLNPREAAHDTALRLVAVLNDKTAYAAVVPNNRHIPGNSGHIAILEFDYFVSDNPSEITVDLGSTLAENLEEEEWNLGAALEASREQGRNTPTGRFRSTSDNFTNGSAIVPGRWRPSRQAPSTHLTVDATDGYSPTSQQDASRLRYSLHRRSIDSVLNIAEFTDEPPSRPTSSGTFLAGNSTPVNEQRELSYEEPKSFRQSQPYNLAETFSNDYILARSSGLLSHRQESSIKMPSRNSLGNLSFFAPSKGPNTQFSDFVPLQQHRPDHYNPTPSYNEIYNQSPTLSDPRDSTSELIAELQLMMRPLDSEIVPQPLALQLTASRRGPPHLPRSSTDPDLLTKTEVHSTRNRLYISSDFFKLKRPGPKRTFSDLSDPSTQLQQVSVPDQNSPTGTSMQDNAKFSARGPRPSSIGTLLDLFSSDSNNAVVSKYKPEADVSSPRTLLTTASRRNSFISHFSASPIPPIPARSKMRSSSAPPSIAGQSQELRPLQPLHPEWPLPVTFSPSMPSIVPSADQLASLSRRHIPDPQPIISTRQNSAPRAAAGANRRISSAASLQHAPPVIWTSSSGDVTRGLYGMAPRRGSLPYNSGIGQQRRTTAHRLETINSIATILEAAEEDSHPTTYENVQAQSPSSLVKEDFRQPKSVTSSVLEEPEQNGVEKPGQPYVLPASEEAPSRPLNAAEYFDALQRRSGIREKLKKKRQARNEETWGQLFAREKR